MRKSITLAAAAMLALGVTSCTMAQSEPEDTPEKAAEAWLAAVAAGDVEALPAMTAGELPRTATELLPQALETISDPAVLADDDNDFNDAVEARLAIEFTLDGETYESSMTLSRVSPDTGAPWLVDPILSRVSVNSGDIDLTFGYRIGDLDADSGSSTSLFPGIYSIDVPHAYVSADADQLTVPHGHAEFDVTVDEGELEQDASEIAATSAAACLTTLDDDNPHETVDATVPTVCHGEIGLLSDTDSTPWESDPTHSEAVVEGLEVENFALHGTEGTTISFAELTATMTQTSSGTVYPSRERDTDFTASIQLQVELELGEDGTISSATVEGLTFANQELASTQER